jgi:hypothetical protein
LFLGKRKAIPPKIKAIWWEGGRNYIEKKKIGNIFQSFSTRKEKFEG